MTDASDTGTTARSRNLTAIVLIVSLFFLWGVANNLNDVLIKHFKKAFILSDLESGLVQSAFYFGYFCFAIPARKDTCDRPPNERGPATGPDGKAAPG